MVARQMIGIAQLNVQTLKKQGKWTLTELLKPMQEIGEI
jgi:hypothetical protein